MNDKILVLDFGGQYNQLIARRVREHHVYSEIKPYNKISVEEIKEAGYSGIIFTGGPNSVYDPASPHYDPEILNAGIPILGICYGDQLMSFMAGGKVESAEHSSEYGKTMVNFEENILSRRDRLFSCVRTDSMRSPFLAAYSSTWIANESSSISMEGFCASLKYASR